MKTNRTFLLISAAVVLFVGTTQLLARSTASAPAGEVLEFDDLTMTFEVNSDPDAGVLLHADTGESLARLAIRGPNGERVFGLVSQDPVGLGLTEIFWETAEPDVPSAFLAYPEGEYTVVARTYDGNIVSGVAHVSHDLLEYPVVTAPADGAELPFDDVVIEWNLDPKAASYWIEFDVETEELAYNYTIPIPPGETEFELPEELLFPGATVFAGVAAVGENGNAILTIVEVTLADRK